MYQFTGCPCSVCGKTLTDTDDIVVCPDCGATLSPRLLPGAGGPASMPASTAQALSGRPPPRHSPSTSAPTAARPTRNPPSGAATAAIVFGSEQAAPPPRVDANRQAQQPGGGFNYTRLYQEAQAGGYWQASAASADEPIDGIPATSGPPIWAPPALPICGTFPRCRSMAARARSAFPPCCSAPCISSTAKPGSRLSCF